MSARAAERRNWPLCDRCITFKCVCRYATAAGLIWLTSGKNYLHTPLVRNPFVCQSERRTQQFCLMHAHVLTAHVIFVHFHSKRAHTSEPHLLLLCVPCACGCLPLFSRASTLHLLFTRCAKQKSSNPFLWLPPLTGCWFSCKLEGLNILFMYFFDVLSIFFMRYIIPKNCICFFFIIINSWLRTMGRKNCPQLNAHPKI